MLLPMKLIPEYRPYVWGGERLRPGQKTAEAWVVYEQDRIASGAYAGRTLAEAASVEGPALLGRRALAATGLRFPLLVKLLDCADWLSLQVHPNDAQAQQIEGPGMFGKNEAWYTIDADPDSRLMCGFKPGVTAGDLPAILRSTEVAEYVLSHPAQPGDTISIRPGLIHALGPGLFIYEVQQTSDLTYRVFDWNRPSGGNRPLHIDKSLAVLDPAAPVDIRPTPPVAPGLPAVLIETAYFRLQLVSGGAPVELYPAGETFHAITVVAGECRVLVDSSGYALSTFETLLVPAACVAYTIEAPAGARVLVAGVP
ncbi:MAG: type I phosphomannose isomerase catalytic subunit [Chloroflexota bacterium]